MKPVGSPVDLTWRAWWHALRDAAKQVPEKNLTDRAAGLTYYSVLSVFPGLIVIVALLGVLGTEDTIQSALRIVDDLGPGSAVDTLRGPLENIVDNSSAAGVALVFGVAVALYSASSYIGAFIRATNEIWGVEEGRGFIKLRPLQLVITLGMILVVVVILFALVLTGPLAEAIGEEIGAGDTALTVWSILKWPVLLAIVVGAFGFLYRVSPDARHQGLPWLFPASLLATLLWALGSVGFSLYVANFGSYSNTYGSLAGAVVFLIWIWLTNLALLFGAQFAAELERTAAAAAAAVPPHEPVPIDPADRAEEPTYAPDPGWDG